FNGIDKSHPQKIRVLRCRIVSAFPQWTTEIARSYSINLGSRFESIPCSIQFSQRTTNHISTKANNLLTIISISIPISHCLKKLIHLSIGMSLTRVEHWSTRQGLRISVTFNELKPPEMADTLL
ncbi:hypothetical protein PanWU01x14_063820, partial [Parasponia andersonii]